MTDLLARLEDANPIPEPSDRHEDQNVPSFDALWPAVRQRRRASRRFSGVVAGSPGRLALAGGTAAAATVAALLLSAGTSPTVARAAFPILETHATDLSATDIAQAVSRWLPQGAIAAAIANAHEFPVTDGTGYVLESPDTGTLCLAFTPTNGPAANHGWLLGCGPGTNAEQNGMISTFGFVHGDQDFVALVPTGSSVQLTDDGTTTQIPITDGIATGVVHDTASLTVTVGAHTTTRPIGPQTNPTPGPATSGATSATGASG